MQVLPREKRSRLGMASEVSESMRVVLARGLFKVQILLD